MALVKAGVGAFRMDLIGFNAQNGSVSYGPTDITVTSNADINDYTNFHGTYDYSSGFPQGSVDSIVDTVDGQTHYSVTNMDADATTLFSYIQRGDYFGAEAYVLRGKDTVVGGALDDYLYGFGGNDIIKGGAGADTLVGGAGADKLTGGDNNDIFRFESTSDSTVDKSGRDTILDFHHDQHDKIDLSAIDAKDGTPRNDRFTLVDAFDGHKGELVITAVHGGFLVQGDTDGIDGANFSILVKTDDLQLVKGDFTF